MSLVNKELDVKQQTQVKRQQNGGVVFYLITHFGPDKWNLFDSWSEQNPIHDTVKNIAVHPSMDHITCVCNTANFELRKKLLLSDHFSLEPPRSSVSHPLSWVTLTTVILFLLVFHRKERASSPSENPEERCKTCFPEIEKYHVTPVLFERHWLPVEFKIEYNIATLAFRRLSSIKSFSSAQHLSTLSFSQASRWETLYCNRSQHRNLQSKVLSLSNISSLELSSSTRLYQNHSFCCQTSAEIISFKS